MPIFRNLFRGRHAGLASGGAFVFASLIFAVGLIAQVSLEDAQARLREREVARNQAAATQPATDPREPTELLGNLSSQASTTKPAAKPTTNPLALWRTRVLRGHDDGVIAVAISPDGKLIATGSMDKTVRLWDARSGNALQKLAGHIGGVTCVAFSGDGKRLVSGGSDGIARVWDPANGKLLAVLQGQKGHIHCLAISKNGELVATGSCDSTVRLWDVENEKAKMVIDCRFAVMGVDLSPDERSVLVGTIGPNLFGPDPGNLVSLYSIEGKAIWSLSMPNGVYFTRFAKDGRRFAAACELAQKSKLFVYETATQKQLSVVDYLTCGIMGKDKPALSRDLAVCLLPSGGEAVLTETATGKLKARFYAAHPGANALALAPDGKFAVCAGGGGGDPYEQMPWVRTGDNVARVVNLVAVGAQAKAPPLDVDNSAETGIIRLPMFSISTTPDGQFAAFGEHVSGGEAVTVDDLVHGAELMKIKIPSSQDPVISPDGRLVAIMEGGRLRLMETASGVMAHEFKEPFYAGRFSPDSSQFFARRVVLKPEGIRERFEAFDVKSGALVHAWESEHGEIFWAVSPDGKMVARQIGFSRKNDCKGVTIMLSDLNSGAEIRKIPLDAIEGAMSALYFLPGAVCVVVQKIVYRFDVRTGQALSPLDGHTNQVLAVAPSPDGSQIETVEWEGTARIWDAASGNLLHTYRYPSSWKIAHGIAAAWPAGGQPSVIIVRLEGPELVPLEE